MEEILTYSETTREFLDFLKLDKEYRSDSLDLLEEGKSRYLADLKLNFKNSLESDHLSKKEISLLGVSLAVNADNAVLKRFFAEISSAEGASEAEIAEAVGCASLLSANNVL